MSLINYEFCRKIGQGSYGEVWLVRKRGSKKDPTLVLKKISFKTSTKVERDSAKQECEILRSIRHPNLVRYVDSFEENNCLYIAMVYYEGGDLFHRLQARNGRHLTERQIVEWFIQITMALKYLHNNCILHRDLKTQNVFIAKDSVIKVGDLGIAKQLQSKYDLTKTMVGTPYYMSPELFARTAYNFKSDIWALGCVTYEMATLKHAFKARNLDSLSYKILSGHIPNMPDMYSKDLTNLIKHMLSHNPDDRPATDEILSLPFIQEHIKTFLETCRKKPVPRPKSPVKKPIDAERVMDSIILYRNRPKDSKGSKHSDNDSGQISPDESLCQSYPSPGTLLEDDVILKALDRSNSDRKQPSVKKMIKSPLISPNQSPRLSIRKQRLPHSEECLVGLKPSSGVNRERSDSLNNMEKNNSPQISPIHSAKKHTNESNIPGSELSPNARQAQLEKFHRDSLTDLEKELEKSQILGNDKDKRNGQSESSKLGARARRRQKRRDEGLQTLCLPDISAPAEQDECNLPELKLPNPGICYDSDDDSEETTENGSHDISDLVTNMDETLHVSIAHHVNQMNSKEKGPTENKNETLDRTTLQDRRYQEFRKLLMHAVGFEKLKEMYSILKNMDIEHEQKAKQILLQQYDDYFGHILWLFLYEQNIKMTNDM